MSIASKEGESVFAAFRELVNKLPEIKGGVLSSDCGTEFTNRDFQKALGSFDIAHKVEGNGEVNAIAVLDSAIGQVRRDVKARLIDSREKTWSALLGAAITAHNRRTNATMRILPTMWERKATKNYNFYKLVIMQNDTLTTTNLQKKRFAKVKDQGAFRKPQSEGIQKRF